MRLVPIEAFTAAVATLLWRCLVQAKMCCGHKAPRNEDVENVGAKAEKMSVAMTRAEPSRVHKRKCGHAGVEAHVE